MSSLERYLERLVERVRYTLQEEDEGDERIDRATLEGLLDVCLDHGLGGTMVDTRLGSGFRHLLWLQLFERVISVGWTDTRRPALAYASPRQSRVIHGVPWEAETARPLEGESRRCDAVVIDLRRYHHLIACYMLFRGLVRGGGIVAFLAADRDRHLTGAGRFVEELAVGHVDGRLHDVRWIGTGASAVAWEQVAAEPDPS